jgi:hypothetical protein
LHFADQLLEQGKEKTLVKPNLHIHFTEFLSLYLAKKALDTFNTAVISPVYYVMFTTFTIIASMIMFKDWASQSGLKIATELCGFVTILSGTFLLHKTKDMGNSASGRGSISMPTRDTPVFTNSGSGRSSSSDKVAS